MGIRSLLDRPAIWAGFLTARCQIAVIVLRMKLEQIAHSARSRRRNISAALTDSPMA